MLIMSPYLNRASLYILAIYSHPFYFPQTLTVLSVIGFHVVECLGNLCITVFLFLDY